MADRTSASSTLGLLSWLAASAWLGFVLSIGQILMQRHLRIVHPYAVVFVVLLVITIAAALAGLGLGLWRLLRGPRRRWALLGAILAALPLVCWSAIGVYGWRQWDARHVPNNVVMRLVRESAAALMEFQARSFYRHRLQGEHLVMIYNDGIATPQADLDDMEKHVARMLEMTGEPLGAKIYWVRGDLLWHGGLSFNGLALGSATSPPRPLDRHELAHAVLNLPRYPAPDAPTMLNEGWAQSQAGGPDGSLAFEAFQVRASAPAEGWLRKLTSDDWYHQDSGPVYGIGGAFVDFLLRKHGPKKFVEFYNACLPGTFERECQRVYGQDIDALENEFWKSINGQANAP